MHPIFLPRQTPGQSGISRISPIFPPHPVAGGRTAHRLTSRTGSAARYELVISFFDAKGNNLGGTSFKGTVKANDYINIPEKQTVMEATAVKEIYTAKYLLILK